MILQAVIVIGVAALAALGVILIGHGRTMNRQLPRLAEGWSGVALAVCLLVAAVGVAGPLRWPPAPRWSCLVHVVGLVSLGISVVLAIGFHRTVRIALCAALAGTACAWLVDLPEAESVAWRAALAVLVIAQAAGLQAVQNRACIVCNRDVAVGLWMAVLLFAAARFFQMASIVAAPALFVTAVPRALGGTGGRSTTCSAAVVLTTLFAATALVGYVYNSGTASPWGWSLLAAWPVAVSAMAWCAGGSRRRAWVGTAVLLAASSTVLGLSDMHETWQYICEQLR